MLVFICWCGLVVGNIITVLGLLFLYLEEKKSKKELEQLTIRNWKTISVLRLNGGIFEDCIISLDCHTDEILVDEKGLLRLIQELNYNQPDVRIRLVNKGEDNA